jgi:hypothetical protein
MAIGRRLRSGRCGCIAPGHDFLTEPLQLTRRTTQLGSSLVGAAEHRVDLGTGQLHENSVTKLAVSAGP